MDGPFQRLDNRFSPSPRPPPPPIQHARTTLHAFSDNAADMYVLNNDGRTRSLTDHFHVPDVEEGRGGCVHAFRLAFPASAPDAAAVRAPPRPAPPPSRSCTQVARTPCVVLLGVPAPAGVAWTWGRAGSKPCAACDPLLCVHADSHAHTLALTNRAVVAHGRSACLSYRDTAVCRS
jgi:hypothetical protein